MNTSKTTKKESKAQQQDIEPPETLNKLMDGLPAETLTIPRQELAETCNKCGKTKNALAIDGFTLITEGGVTTCQKCKMLSKIEQQDNKPIKKIQKPISKSTDEITIKPHQLPNPSPPSDLNSEIKARKQTDRMDSVVEKELDEIIMKQNKDLLTQYDTAIQNIGAFLTANEVSMVRSQIDFPPMVNRIMTTFKVVRLSIRMSHPATDQKGIDLNVNPEAINDPMIAPWLELGEFEFRIERGTWLEYLITVSIMVAEALKESITTAGFFDRRAEKWWGVVSYQLEELQSRVMSLTGSFLTLTGNPFEINKIFADVYVALARLASIEQRINKDVGGTIKKNWGLWGGNEQVEFIIKNFDTKYISSFKPEDKTTILDILLADPDIFEEVDNRWEMILTMVGKIRPKNREKLLKALREKLMPDEIEILVPELAKYRGKIV